jgi:hypothetical protein
MTTNPFTIGSDRSLPSVDELLQILAAHKDLAIRYGLLPSDYVRELTYAFPDHSVFDREWDKTIFIHPSVHSSMILQKKFDLYECAKAFRQDANQLMGLMANTFGIDLQTLDRLHELKFKKSHNQRGTLNREWTYFLHGEECRFENTITGQIVEIIVINRPEFGYLDGYFFYQYMATTEWFKMLAAAFDNNYLHICKAIDLLVFEGVLTKHSSLETRRNIIAL